MSASPFFNIPEELRLLPNWVLWKLVSIEGKKPTKVPYHPNGHQVGAINPNSWVTFDVAFDALQFGGYDGLGFVFTNTEYAGIDLDDPSFLDGTNNPNYQIDLTRQIKIAQDFNSYSEVSPSGKGLHIIVKGSVPAGINNRKSHIEIYSTGRYFTMTGNVHNNKPITDHNDLLNQLWTQIGGVLNSPTPIITSQETNTDAEILELAHKHNETTFTPLVAGAWQGLYPSQSEADQAFLNIIAYYTNSTAQVERIFRASNLMREKVNKHKTYLSRSITKAFDQKISLINIDNLNEAFQAKKLKNGAAINKPNPAKYVRPDGLLGDIAKFIYDAAPHPVPEIALAGAIGLMSGICGKAYNISNTGLNQYILLLAPTGTGKEAMASGIGKLIFKARDQVPTAGDFIGPTSIASAPGLHKWLSKNSQCFVSILGEFGLKLEAMCGAKANTNQIAIKDSFLDLYNKSGKTNFLGSSAYSDQEKNSAVISAPAFSILGESTPETFYAALSEKMISEGLLPRFSIIEYTGDRMPFNENPKEPDHSLMRDLCSILGHVASLMANGKVVEVLQNDEALKLTRYIAKFCTDQVNISNSAHKTVISNLWTRGYVKVVKLAGLVAVGINPYNPVVTENDVQWAWSMVKQDIEHLSTKFDAGEIGTDLSQSNQSREMTRILKEYVEKDFDYVSKYGAKEQLHNNKIVNNTFLSLRLKKLAPFRNDKLGELAALARCIKSFIDNGVLVSQDISKFGLTGAAWKISVSALDDMID